MASKRDSGEWAGSRRLPSVREKLSGFVRRGRGLAKKTTLAVLGEPRHERPSLDESRKAFPRVQVRDFGSSSLEIDLQSLEAFRVSPQPAREKKAEPQQPQLTSSTTPIADMFARKATTTEPATVHSSSLNQSSPSLLAPSVRRLGHVSAEERRPSNAPSYTTNTSSSAINVTIINSSHAQSHTSRPWPPPEAPRTVAPTRTQVSTMRQPTRTQLREPQRAAYVPSTPGPITTPHPISRSRPNVIVTAEQQQLPSNADKRHSTPMPPLITVPNSLPAETVRADLRRSWQPAPTSAPSGVSTPSAPPSASAPWRGIPTRQVSTRLAGDRLAWIRELEEGKKKGSTIRGDLPVLRTMQGSVADKLARFESKQQQQQLAPITRSNSTRSRPSSIADTFSSQGGMATTRSSLDSHRTSSVFSHYDDSFREKMELIAGSANRKADDDHEEKPALTRVTASFVSVGKENKQANVETQANIEAQANVEELEANVDGSEANVEESEALEQSQANVEEPQNNVEGPEVNIEEPRVNVEESQILQESQAKTEESEALEESQANVEESESPEGSQPNVEEPQTHVEEPRTNAEEPQAA